MKVKINKLHEYFNNLKEKTHFELLKIMFEQINIYANEYKISKNDLNDFDDIIIMMINSDSYIRPGERRFWELWLKRKKSFLEGK